MAEVMSNAVRVRKFIDKGATIPVPTSEFMEFWKACSLEERQQFNDEVLALEAA